MSVRAWWSKPIPFFAYFNSGGIMRFLPKSLHHDATTLFLWTFLDCKPEYGPAGIGDGSILTHEGEHQRQYVRSVLLCLALWAILAVFVHGGLRLFLLFGVPASLVTFYVEYLLEWLVRFLWNLAHKQTTLQASSNAYLDLWAEQSARARANQQRPTVLT